MCFRFLASILLAVRAITSCLGTLQPATCYAGHRYALSENSTAWPVANSSCVNSRAGYLTTINGQDEQTFLFNTYFGRAIPYTWLGLNDRGIGNEGNFTWTDGTTSLYRNWAEGQPNRTGDCVVVFHESGEWSDFRCGIGRARFLCEEVPPTPGEWFVCNDKQWRLFPIIHTWRAAERRCQEHGGHLANMGLPTDAACARRALHTCLNANGDAVTTAFNGFHDLFGAGTFVWSSNNALHIEHPIFPLPAHTICGGFSDELVIGQSCNASLPFVCGRPLPNASDPFSATCGNLAYTYNPLAFSWSEADRACRTDNGMLLNASSPAPRGGCVAQLFTQLAFSTNSSAAADISMWVRCRSGQCSSQGPCPSWSFNPNSSIDMLNCSDARPYICVHALGAVVGAVTTPTSSTASQEQAGESSGEASSTTVAIIGAVIGVCLALVVALLVFLILRRRKRNQNGTLPTGSHLHTTAVSNALYTNPANNGQSQHNSSKPTRVYTAKESVQPTRSDDYENATPADQSMMYSEAQAGWQDPAAPPVSQRDSSLSVSQSNVYDEGPSSPHRGSSMSATTHLIESPRAGADPTYHTLERENSAAQGDGTPEQTYNTLDRHGSGMDEPSDDAHASVDTAEVYQNTLQAGMYSMLDKQSTMTSPVSRRQSWSFEPDASGVLYEAVPARFMDKSSSGSASKDESFTGGGNSADIYESIQLAPNEHLYQEPPHEEAEVFAVLRRPIYRHIHRSELDLQDQIGGGNFGVVTKASWNLDGKVYPAAVKTLREGADEAQKVEFLKEAIVMGQFYHRNVVTMFGVVDDSEPYMLVLELMNTALRPHLYGLLNRTSKSVVTSLHRFCVDIAAGMAYLAGREFVHRDLAARNVLMDGNGTCKIADFGLSRNLDGGDYYISQSTGPIPVKWTAPEALNFHRYSTKSDVWSFGIVVHEIFAFGKKPYFGMTNEKVLTMVREGYRMEKAPRCPDDIYELQQRCWNEDPHQRPQFSEILQVLTQVHGRLSPCNE